MATQGRPLRPDFKRAIVLVKDYFDRTKGDLREQEGSSAERTANALGVGLATVKRVMADSKRSPGGLIRKNRYAEDARHGFFQILSKRERGSMFVKRTARARISRLRCWLSI